MKTFYWLNDSNKKKYPTLKKEIKTNILIIGGGISGISLAYELSKFNFKITLVEQNQLYHATTGYTTGKLTIQHGYIYQKLVKKSIKLAKSYYEGNKNAINHLKEIIFKENIHCDFQICNHSLISKTKDKSFLLEEKAYQKMNISYEKRKIKDYYALTLKDQAIFHVVKYLDGILNYLEKCENVNIYEYSKVLKTKNKIAIGENFKIHFDQVIFACNYPPYQRFNFYFLKLKPVMSFIGIAHIKEHLNKTAIKETQPTFSFRPLPCNQIMFAGYSQNNSNLKSYLDYKKLISLTKKEFQIVEDEINYNQDLQTIDKIPYIGKIKKDFYLVTGFNKWGLSSSILASLIIKDLINNKKNVYENIFSPKRHISLFSIIIYTFKNLFTWVHSKFFNSKKKCTHLHCNLAKNFLSKTYDCPCHGSRFDDNGEVITGPAKKNLK